MSNVGRVSRRARPLLSAAARKPVDRHRRAAGLRSPVPRLERAHRRRVLRAQRLRPHPRRRRAHRRHRQQLRAHVVQLRPDAAVVAREHAPDTYARILEADASARSPRAATATPSRRPTTTPSCRCATSAIGARRSAGAWPISSAASAAAPRRCGCPRPRCRRRDARGAHRRGAALHHPLAAPGRGGARATATGSTSPTATIDPTQPYRLHAPSGRSIAVFFYDGPISSAIGFEGALFSAATLVERLLGARRGDRGRDQLVHVATDGEIVRPPHALRRAARSPTRSPSRRRARGFRSPTTPPTSPRIRPPPRRASSRARRRRHRLELRARRRPLDARLRLLRRHARLDAGVARPAAPARSTCVRDRAAALYRARGERALARSLGRARSLRRRARPAPRRSARLPAAEHARARRRRARYARCACSSCSATARSCTPAAAGSSTSSRGLEATQILRYASRALELHRARRRRRSRADVPGHPRRSEVEPARVRRRRRSLPPPGRAEPRRPRAASPRKRRSCRCSCRARASSATATIRIKRFGERRAGDARFGLVTGRINLRWRPTGERHELAYAVLHVGAADVCCAVAPAAAGQRDAVDAVWREWPRQSIARAGARHRAQLRPRRVHDARSAARGAPSRPARGLRRSVEGRRRGVRAPLRQPSPHDAPAARRGPADPRAAQAGGRVGARRALRGGDRAATAVARSGALSPRHQDGRRRARARPVAASRRGAARVRRDAVRSVGGDPQAKPEPRAHPARRSTSSRSAVSSASTPCRRARKSSSGRCSPSRHRRTPPSSRSSSPRSASRRRRAIRLQPAAGEAENAIDPMRTRPAPRAA